MTKSDSTGPVYLSADTFKHVIAFSPFDPTSNYQSSLKITTITPLKTNHVKRGKVVDDSLI